MNLQRVKPSFHLHWPETFGPASNRYRGAPGYVVDLDAPFESRWCAGQVHKFEPAPKGSVASKIEHPRALRELRDESKRVAAAPAPEPKIATDLPSVDPIPTRKGSKV